VIKVAAKQWSGRVTLLLTVTEICTGGFAPLPPRPDQTGEASGASLETGAKTIRIRCLRSNLERRRQSDSSSRHTLQRVRPGLIQIAYVRYSILSSTYSPDSRTAMPLSHDSGVQHRALQGMQDNVFRLGRTQEQGQLREENPVHRPTTRWPVFACCKLEISRATSWASTKPNLTRSDQKQPQLEERPSMPFKLKHLQRYVSRKCLGAE